MKGKGKKDLEAAGWTVENLNTDSRTVRGPAWKICRHGEKYGYAWTEVDAWLLAAQRHLAQEREA